MFQVKNLLKRAFYSFVVIGLSIHSASATGSVKTALTNATTEVKGAFEPLSQLMYAVMAIIAIVGAISVYGKWSNGDPDTRKAAASWFGALIFAGLVLLVIKAVFGV